MQLSHPPSQRIFLLSFMIVLAVLSASIVGFRLVYNLIILVVIGICYAATNYQPRVFRACFALTVLAVLAVVWLTVPSADLLKEAFGIALVSGTTLISCELIYALRTAQRASERALAAQTEHYRQISALTTDYVLSVTFDQQNEPVSDWFTDSLVRLTGYTYAELSGSKIWELLCHPNDQDRLRQIFVETAAGRIARVDLRIITRSGATRWIRTVTYPETDSRQQTIRLVSAGQDITAQYELEQQLRTQNSYLEALHAAVLGLISHHPQIDDLLHDLINRTASLFAVEYACLYLYDQTIDAMVPHVGIGYSESQLDMPLRRGEGMVGVVWETQQTIAVDDYCTWKHRVQDDDLRLLHAGMAVPLMRDEQVIGVLGVNSSIPEKRFEPAEVDLLTRFAQIAAAVMANAQLYADAQRELTARLHAETELRRERRLFIDGPAVVFKWQLVPGYPVEYVSPNIRQFGYTPEQLTSGALTFTALVHPEDRSRTGQEIVAHLERGATSFAQQYRLITSNGSIRWVHDFSIFVRDPNGNPTHIDGYLLDETASHLARQSQHELEQQLREAQRLESLGLLAGGIAHDFNNLLAAIQGNAGLALLDLEQQHPAYHSVQQVQRAATRAAGLTRQLLAYAGKGRVLIQPVNLNALLEDMTAILQTSISKKIDISHQLSLQVPDIHADATQIQQVIMNLIVNAAEAIGDQEGRILVRTSVQPGRTSLQPEGSADPAAVFVVLQISDTGSGMGTETLSKIFDPFFTTKFTGRGLGLAAVRGIINSHQGRLLAESAPGHGSTFTIWLPASSVPATLVEPASSLLSAEPALATPPNRLQTTILVIEDEADIRSLARRTLERLGMSVLTAQDGVIGMDLLTANQHIDCILLDLLMPRMDGQQTLLAIGALRPSIPVVVMSGYSDDQIREQLDGTNPLSFLAKPFGPTQLSQAIQHALQTDPSLIVRVS